jgi:hypothetical protein
MSEERSGMDMLKEILFRLDKLEKSLAVLDSNIKAVANSTKMAELINKANQTPLKDWKQATIPAFNKEEHVADVKKQIEDARKDAMEKVNTGSAGFKNFNFNPTNASAQGMPMMTPGVPNIPAGPRKLVVVKGTMKIDVDGAQTALSGASVKIFDANDELVKSTRTNRAGHWMSHLGPGKYVALFEGEFAGKKLLPQNRNFEVPEKLPDGVNEIEVN